MNKYDIVFIGHVTIDEIVATEGASSGTGGGAPLFGAIAASVTGKKIAVITRIAKEHKYLVEALEKNGIDVYREYTQNTTHMRVVHPSANIDERQMYQTKDAGFFKIDEIPSFETRLIHLGALTDREFTLEYMKKLRKKGFRLSVDMQGFVRQVDKSTRIIRFGDVPEKKEIMGLADFVKLDLVEAEILTGTDNLSKAAGICEAWGSQETLITRSEGVLVRKDGKDYFEHYSNRSNSGRTGRGDTTFGAYLSKRLDNSIEESIKFAASLASIKMEVPGPFTGTLADVVKRMNRVL
ncbi:MAG TPA: PfkB family carbohydrate kinase [Syntrophorhabdus sp.]|nr:PfkB family carbohydrate kinase [Syntrophorhabdus sp.]